MILNLTQLESAIKAAETAYAVWLVAYPAYADAETAYAVAIDCRSAVDDAYAAYVIASDAADAADAACIDAKAEVKRQLQELLERYS